MNPQIQLRKATQLSIVVVCFGFSPAVWAVNPPPDGGYPNQNTAEGTNALFHLNIGARNTAVGFRALYTNTASSDNTAVGWQALLHNTSGTDNTSTGAKALFRNTTGDGNTATGYQALSNTIRAVRAIQLSAIGHFGKTQLAASTQPTVPKRFLTTRPEVAILQ